MSTERLSESVEDYLKAIYNQTQDGGSTSTNRLASELSVSAASVTSMLKRLSELEPAPIDYTKHHGVRLTSVGRTQALRTIRQHRLLELFLVRVLGYSWDQVHAEAERLAHVISPLFVERMAAVLGEPAFDPHGDPIPTRDLTLPPSDARPLQDLGEGEVGVVCRVLSSDSGLLQYLSKLGVQPGVRISLKAKNIHDGTMQVGVGSQEQILTVGKEIGDKILIEK